MKESDTTSKGLSGKAAFGLAFLLGVIAFVLFWAHGRKAEIAWQREMGERHVVVVADDDILPGREITSRQIRTEDVFSRMLQPNALQNPESVLRRVSQIPIREGQQILETMLHEEGGGFLSLRVGRAPDRRAITLNFDGEGVLAGLIKPGDHVDVMGIFEASAPEGSGGQPRNHAMIIVQAVKVLAVNRRMSEFGGSEGAYTDGRASSASAGGGQQSALVTLDVDAEQAWQLGLASQIAHLRCLLRHRMNTDAHPYVGPEPGQHPRIESDRVFQAGGRTIEVMKPIELDHRWE